ncbi:hypothetical protein Zmor_013527 [Zophobas morio]|uniref:Integrase zinc-binding domain-containing protein n=1 Tax=Zophobas morio TaxID=2755281 RepID=A0AA38ID73_9CUCU|nr:hypothetical protein Zmor_013527 [Zophobas morio]
MDLIIRHGLTIDPVREVIRLENKEFKLNQRCIGAKPESRTHVTMRLVVPATRIKEVLREMHNRSPGAHFGITKTLSKIRERFYCQQGVAS